MKKKILKVALGFFLGGIVFLLIMTMQSKGLKLGSTVSIYKNTIPPSGGLITIEDKNSSLKGFYLGIPKGAYNTKVEYEIKTTEIKGHNYGELFNPITPLIRIENGHKFAKVPMVVSIPIHKTDDEFAMGFYYDEKTKKLEGIPFLNETNDHIDLITSHFSNILVSKVKKGKIIDDIDTGFITGRDDIETPNLGSYIEPGGYCAGQSIAELYYFQQKGRIGYTKTLHGLLDNFGGDRTDGFWNDDALAIRLGSVIQKNYTENWWRDTEELNDYKTALGMDDEATYYAFAYSMQLTKMPQYIAIRGTNKEGNLTGHALVAYRVTKDELFVADPNFPGRDRSITFAREKDKKYFKPYSSGANANDIGTNDVKYDKFGYFGYSALVDMDYVAKCWDKALITKDIGDGIFPNDIEFEVIMGKDKDGNFKTEKLQNNMTITPNDLKQAGMTQLYIRSTNDYPTDKLYLYKDKTAIGEIRGSIRISLDNGKNNLGILHMKILSPSEKEYVNFKRYIINYSEEAAAEINITPKTSNIKVGEIVNFNTNAVNLSEKPYFVWSFGDGSKELSGNFKEMPHMYEKEGVFKGSVKLYDSANKTKELANDTFIVTVTAAKAKEEKGEIKNIEPLLGHWDVGINGDVVAHDYNFTKEGNDYVLIDKYFTKATIKSLEWVNNKFVMKIHYPKSDYSEEGDWFFVGTFNGKTIEATQVFASQYKGINSVGNMTQRLTRPE